MNLPKVSTTVASVIAVLVILGVFGFIFGIGSGWLKYQDPQFNLLFGYLAGAGTTVLAFLYGSSKQGERAQEIAAQPAAPTIIPGAAAGDRERLAEMTKHLAELAPGPEAEKLAADIAALQAKIAGR